MNADLILLMQERDAVNRQFLQLAKDPFDHLTRLSQLALIGGRMDKLIRDALTEARKARRA